MTAIKAPDSIILELNINQFQAIHHFLSIGWNEDNWREDHRKGKTHSYDETTTFNWIDTMNEVENLIYEKYEELRLIYKLERL